jgi:hypothetical protein
MYGLLISNKQYDEQENATIDETIELYNTNVDTWHQLDNLDQLLKAVKLKEKDTKKFTKQRWVLVEVAITRFFHLKNLVGSIFEKFQTPRTYSSFLRSFRDYLYELCLKARTKYQALFPPSALKKMLLQRTRSKFPVNVDIHNYPNDAHVMMDISPAAMLKIIDDSHYYNKQLIKQRLEMVQIVVLSRRWTYFDTEDTILVDSKLRQLMRSTIASNAAVTDLSKYNWNVQQALINKESIIDQTTCMKIAQDLRTHTEENVEIQAKHAGIPYVKQEIEKWLSTLVLRVHDDADFTVDVQFFAKTPRERQVFFCNRTR